MNRNLLFCWVLFHSSLFGVFTNEVLLITSFPNISQRTYTLSSFSTTIHTGFPLMVAPGTKLLVHGVKKHSSFYIASDNDITILRESSSWLTSFAQYRVNLSEKILQFYPRSGKLILALILGNRSYLDDDFMDYVKFSGMAHLFALSGLHLIIAIGFFIYLAQILGFRQKYWGLIVLPFSIMYLFIGGFGIPLQRAVLFHIVGAIYQIFRIPSSGKNIFFISLGMNLLLLPKNVQVLSFWLSYLSVFGIVFCYKFWYDIIKKYFNLYISSMLAVSVSVSVLITPLLIYFFGYINLWSVGANLIMVPMMPFILIICFMSMILCILDIHVYFLDLVIDIIYQFIYKIVMFFSEIPFGVIFFESKTLGVVLSLCISIIIMIIIQKRSYERLE